MGFLTGKFFQMLVSSLLISIVSNWTGLPKNSRKQDRIYYLHDNTRSNVAKSTCEKLLKLGWITVLHPPYSPDLAPTDYHLFPSLSHHLGEKKFDDDNDMKMDIANFFGQKFKDFYERGILSLPERWRQVIDSSGAYIT